jgi:hypothetical protein
MYARGKSQSRRLELKKWAASIAEAAGLYRVRPAAAAANATAAAATRGSAAVLAAMVAAAPSLHGMCC